MTTLSNVDFYRGERAILRNFSLEVPQGGRVFLFGPSGCGKTTVLRLIAGLEIPDKGQIVVPNKISMVFQEYRLCPHISVLQNLLMVTNDPAQALTELATLGIADCAEKKPGKISGGQRQRAAIARALCADSDLLLLDEPFNGIDEENIRIVCDEILRIYKDKSIIMVSHDLSHAELIGAEIINI